jgi:hypothetical protein
MERAKRASLGQTFGAPDETAISLKVLVSNKLVGGVIGKAGATINAIKEASGAKVKVKAGPQSEIFHDSDCHLVCQVSNNTEVFPGTTDRIILLSGSLNSVLTAARMVVAELFKETPKENPEPTFAEVSRFYLEYVKWTFCFGSIDFVNIDVLLVSDHNGRHHCGSCSGVWTHHWQRRRKN